MLAGRTHLLRTAAESAVEQAEAAARAGTFGVGAALVCDGELAVALPNSVVQNGVIFDSTAHAEMQTIRWYLSEGGRRNMPPPHECTIVTTLDPCMQCAGALLSFGFHVVSMTPDASSGVQFAGWGNFSTLPVNLRERAAQRFSVYERDAADGLIERASAAFSGTLRRVQATIAASDDPSPETKPAPGVSIGELNALLTQYASYVYGGDAAAVVSPNGKVLALASGRRGAPFKSAAVTVFGAYSCTRTVDRGSPHPRACRLYTLRGPGREASDVMDVGAFGSFLEGPSVEPARAWRYFEERQPDADLAAMLAAFPPLYSRTIGISPQPIPRSAGDAIA